MKHFFSYTQRLLPYISLFNVTLLLFLGVCLYLINGILPEPHILSYSKGTQLYARQICYLALLKAFSVFNMWLVFWPMCRFVYVYYYALKIEVEHFCFDLLLLFASLLFSFIFVYGFFFLNTWLLLFTAHLGESSPDVNLYLQMKDVLFQNVPANCSTCGPKPYVGTCFVATPLQIEAEDGAPTSGNSGGVPTAKDKNQPDDPLYMPKGATYRSNKSGHCIDPCNILKEMAKAVKETITPNPNSDRSLPRQAVDNLVTGFVKTKIDDAAEKTCEAMDNFNVRIACSSVEAAKAVVQTEDPRALDPNPANQPGKTSK